MQRIAKVISSAGVCSRREAERLIAQGLVKVDGIVIDSSAILVDSGNVIEVQNRQIKQTLAPRLWIYYKPTGLLTTHSDPQGRETVFEHLGDLPRVISVGRLDLNSEGLLLLTNNGELARFFELPVNKMERVYKVRAYGNTKELERAKFPVEIDRIIYNPKEIKLIKKGATNSWFEVVLEEGKNREIRKIFEYFGLSVSRLIRVKYGPFLLGELKEGEYLEQNLSKFKDIIK
jgi:23S rRNA pseudouridine2605 synthase